MRFAGRVSAANYIAAGRNAAEQSASFAKTAADNAPDFQSLSEESIRQEAKNYDDAVKNAASIINSSTVAQRDIDLSKAKVEIYEAEKEGERGVRKAGLLVKGAGALGSALTKEPERKLRQTDTSLLQSEYNRLTGIKDEANAKAESIMGEEYTPSTPSQSTGEDVSTNISAQSSFDPNKVMSKNQVFDLAKSQGFNDSDARTVVGISGGESGRDPSNSTKREIPGRQNLWQSQGEDSVGIMQINWGYHKDRGWLQKLGITKREQLLDPVTNMKAAKYLHTNSKGFSDWTVYNEGIYKDFL